MNITLSDKMHHFQTSIFNELSNYKKKKNQEGNEMIDLSLGSPDLPPAKYVIDELAKHVTHPGNYGYTLTGIDELHRTIATYYHNQYSVTVDPVNETLMVMGSQDGLVHLPMALTNPGDIILLPDPGYTAYDTGVALAGAAVYGMPLKEDNNFLPDLEAIPGEIREKAKLMILNFPGNPVPALATKKFFEQVVAFAKKHQIVVVHDFAYAEIYYEDKPVSFLSIKGAIRALENSVSFSEELRAIYKRRRDILVSGLNALGWKVDTPSASMFIWAKVPKPFTSTEFVYRLMDETGIVVVPGNAFGEAGEGYVRIGLVQPEEVLKKAVAKLRSSILFSTTEVPITNQ